MNQYLIILYYSVSHLIYSLIKEGNFKQILPEFIASIDFVIWAILLLFLQNDLIKSGLIILLFLSTTLGVRFFSGKKNNNGHPKIGIIDFVWLCLMGIICGGLVYFQSLSLLQENVAQRTQTFLQTQINQNQFIIGKSIDLLLVIGSIVAVCMSIIWSKDVWRETDKAEEYISTTKSAISMAFACLVICVSILVWVSKPLYMQIIQCMTYLK